MSRFGVPPWELTRKRSCRPSRFVDVNRMLRPSGDQCGPRVAGPTDEVNWMGLEPSLSHTQISFPPERDDTKTIRLASGEYSGSSSACVDQMSLTGCAALPLLADVSTIQMSQLVRIKRE